MRRLAAGLSAVVCLGLADPTASEAAPVTFSFTGAVTQALFDPNDPSGGDITFGTAFSGSYTFESTAPDRVPSGASGSYRMPEGAPYGFAVNFGPGHDFITSDFLNIGVINNSASDDQYSVFACFGGFTCSGGITMALSLNDIDGSVFASDALPVGALPFEAFEVATFVLRGLIDGNEVEILGSLDSLACTDGCLDPQPVPVPEPGTMLLLSPALAALAWRRRRRAGSVVSAGVLAIVLSGFATNAYAVDGVILIDQTRAMAGGITPSDSPGFPVTITRSGSYRLASNLNVPPDAAGIVIFASGVTIDLNGFQIIGSAEGTGISALPARQAIVVRNGSITNFDKGVDIKGLGNEVRDMTAYGNSVAGLDVGPGATVSNNRAFSNGEGIRVGAGSVVTNNTVLFNTNAGLRVEEASVIRGNNAVRNAVGFVVVCPSLVIANAANGNSESEIQFVNNSDGNCAVPDNNLPLP